MSEATDPQGPVFGFRRWRVTDDGRLMGLGLAEIWNSARQTAVCKGERLIRVAEYCDEPELVKAPDRYSFAHAALQYGLGAPARTTYPLPDGKWVQLVERKTCQYELDPDHPVPSLRSLCGIWAHKQPIPDCTCPEPTSARHGAVGVVRMWGRSVEHVDGWRTEHAELVAVVDHSGRLRDYDAPKYATTGQMYAEWAPDADGWAARHDRVWCSYDPFLGGYVYGGPAWNYQPPSSIGSSVGANLPPLPSMSLQQIYAALGVGKGDEDKADPKAKALQDKQTRNANHPGQDRPERSRRKRKGWRR